MVLQKLNHTKKRNKITSLPNYIEKLELQINQNPKYERKNCKVILLIYNRTCYL